VTDFRKMETFKFLNLAFIKDELKAGQMMVEESLKLSAAICTKSILKTLGPKDVTDWKHCLDGHSESSKEVML